MPVRGEAVPTKEAQDIVREETRYRRYRLPFRSGWVTLAAVAILLVPASGCTKKRPGPSPFRGQPPTPPAPFLVVTLGAKETGGPQPNAWREILLLPLDTATVPPRAGHPSVLPRPAPPPAAAPTAPPAESAPALSPDGRFLLDLQPVPGGCLEPTLLDLTRRPYAWKRAPRSPPAAGGAEAKAGHGGDAPAPLADGRGLGQCHPGHPAFAPDGRSLAYAVPGRESTAGLLLPGRAVHVKEAERTPRRLLAFTPPGEAGFLTIRGLAWSPDGRYLAWLGVAYASEGVNWPLYLAEAASGQVRPLAAWGAALAWGPAGRLFFLTAPEPEPGSPPDPNLRGRLYSLNPAEPTVPPRLETEFPSGERPGSTLAFIGATAYYVLSSDAAAWSRDEIVARDLASGASRLLFRAPPGRYVQHLAAAPSSLRAGPAGTRR